MIKFCRFKYKTVIIIFFLFFLENSQAISQNKTEPSIRNIQVGTEINTKDTLPNISLPEFVITGKEKFEMPDYPKSEIKENHFYLIPKLRNIDIGQRDFTTAEIGIPGKLYSRFQNEKFASTGFLDIGYGMYYSPNISLGLSYNINSNNSIQLFGNYESSKGFIEYSDYTKGNFSLIHKLLLPETDNIFSNAELKTSFKFDYDKYNCFGSLLEDNASSITLLSKFILNRSFQKYNLSFDFFKKDQLRYLYNFNINLKYNIMSDSEDSSRIHNTNKTIVNSWILSNNFSVRKEFDYLDFYFAYDLFLNKNSNNNINLFERFPTERYLKHFILTFGLEKNISSKLILNTSANFHLFNEKEINYIPDFITDRTKIYFNFTSTYLINEDISFYFKYIPNIRLNTLYDYFDENKYIYNIISNPVINEIDLQFGTKFNIFSSINGEFNFLYLKQQNTIINIFYFFNDKMDVDCFPKATSPIFMSIINLDNTYFYLPSFNLKYKIDSSSNVSLVFKYQKIKTQAVTLTYTPVFLFSLEYNYIAPFNLEINPQINIIGSRYIYDRFEDMLKPHILLNSKFEYKLLNFLKIYLNLYNILNQKIEIVKGYKDFPFTLNFGLNFKW